MTSKLKLLSTVAASMLLSVNIASAQSSIGDSHRSRPESAQQHGKGTVPNGSRSHGAARSSGKSQTTPESKSGGTATRKKSSTTGQASSAEERRLKSSENTRSGRGISERGKRAATTEHGRKSGTTGQASSSETQGNAAAEKQGGSQTRGQENNKLKNEKAGVRKSGTTGQAQQNEQKTGAEKPDNAGQAAQNENARQPSANSRAAAGSRQTQVQGATLDSQQVTKVQQAVSANRNVPRVETANFAVSVGTEVPSHVHAVAVPSTLVEVYPEWRDDDYFVVRDEIVIVDHRHKIVAVIPARSHRASASEEIDISELNPDEIREVQTVLIERGFLHGRADGIFGSETREALVSFQRKEGLQATGRIDTRTVSSLGLSGKINVGAQGTSATTGQAPGANAPQERQNTKPQAQQKREQNEPPGAQHNASQSQSQTPRVQQSTTGQGGPSQAPDTQRPTRQGHQGSSVQDTHSQKAPGSGSTSGQGNQPEANDANMNNHKRNEQ